MRDAEATPTASTVRKGRKFDQVLEGARAVFMRDGFEGASVDEIARAAGVSKATLYSYFPDKRLLFAEVAKSECLRQADNAIELLQGDHDPRRVLVEAGRRIIAFFTSDFGLSMYRLCVAESHRFPDLGAYFYRSGPQLLRERLTDYFREAVAEGRLEIQDFDLAADQFAELCRASFFPRLLCGVQNDIPETEIMRVLNGAVDMFLARYACKEAKEQGAR